MRQQLTSSRQNYCECGNAKMKQAKRCQACYRTNVLNSRWTAPPEERFWEKVDKNGPVPVHRLDLGACWLWTGALSSGGYGHFWDGTKVIPAFHFLTPGQGVRDHLCRTRACVNPSHIEFVTHRINLLRGVGASARNAKKSHCPQGHPYDADNTRLSGRGFRICRTCAAAYHRALRLKAKLTL